MYQVVIVIAVFTPFGAGNRPLTIQALSGKVDVPNTWSS